MRPERLVTHPVLNQRRMVTRPTRREGRRAMQPLRPRPIVKPTTTSMAHPTHTHHHPSDSAAQRATAERALAPRTSLLQRAAGVRVLAALGVLVVVWATMGWAT